MTKLTLDAGKTSRSRTLDVSTSRTSVVEQMKQVFADQVAVFNRFRADPALKVCMLPLWIASFGSAIHHPVTTFFYIEMGCTSKTIGYFGFLASLGSWWSPLYGYTADRYSYYYPISLSCFLCAFGCLIRGFGQNESHLYFANIVLGLGGGNLWSVALSYVANRAQNAEKTLFISAFMFQQTCLRLLGYVVNPMLDTFLECFFKAKIVRYRIIMSICSFFCVYGTVYLLTKSPKQFTITPSIVELEKSQNSHQWRNIFLILLMMLVQSFSFRTVSVLWPIFLSDYYLWTGREYAFITIFQMICKGVALSSLPVLQQRVGLRNVFALLSFIASLACLSAFSFHPTSSYNQSLHVLNTLILYGALSLLEGCIKAILTSELGAQKQGTVYGSLTLFQSIGGSSAAIAATQLYAHGRTQKMPSLPLLALSVIIFIGSFLVFGMKKAAIGNSRSSEKVSLQSSNSS